MTGKQPQRSQTETRLRAALSGVIDPRSGRDALSGGLVADMALNETQTGLALRLTLELPGGPGGQNDRLAEEIEAAARGVPGIERVTIVTTAHRAASASPRPAPTPGSPSFGGHADPLRTGAGKKEEPVIPGVKAVVAVASGKGGVGKSTLAVNLAAAFAAAGYRTGIVDADISGPSLPVLLGLDGSRAQFRDGKIQPMDAHGLKAMSIGLLVEEAKAVAWRGPMVMGAVRQLFSDVDWGDLDILLVDTPPGTGDAHLTLLQKIPVTGAVIVSTPQEMALADVRRGATLFEKMETPVLGLVENMAWLEMPDGTRQALFGEGGVARMADALGLPLLASLPLEPALGRASDSGTPFVVASPDHPLSGRVRDIARQVAGTLALVPQTRDA